MEITPASLDVIFFGLDARYNAALQAIAAETYWQKLCTDTPSKARENRYFWLDFISDKAEEWLGERTISNLALREYALVNRDWQRTIELDRNTIEDDQVGAFAPKVDMLGVAAGQLWDQLLTTSLQIGDSTTNPLATIYDGQPYYSASHPIQVDNPASATFSNEFTGSPLTAANFNANRVTMMGYLGNNLNPVYVRPNLIVVPPALEMTAHQILNMTFIAPTVGLGMNAANVVQESPLKGLADVVMSPWLTTAYGNANGDGTWYLEDTTKPIKAHTRQPRKMPQFTYLVNPNDLPVFMRRKFLMGWDARGAVGYTLPYFSAKCLPV